MSSKQQTACHLSVSSCLLPVIQQLAAPANVLTPQPNRCCCVWFFSVIQDRACLAKPSFLFNLINKIHVYLFGLTSVIHIAWLLFPNRLSRGFLACSAHPIEPTFAQTRTPQCHSKVTRTPISRIINIINSQDFLSFLRAVGYAISASVMIYLPIVRRFRWSPTFARSNPRVDFASAKLPQPANLMSRHGLALDPLVDGVALDPEVSRDFLYRQPAVFNHSFTLWLQTDFQ